MYKNTNEFFKEVAENKVTEIDTDNYIKYITKNYKYDWLLTFSKDIDDFINKYRYDLNKNLKATELYDYIQKLRYDEQTSDLYFKYEKSIYRYVRFEKRYKYIKFYRMYIDPIRHEFISPLIKRFSRSKDKKHISWKSFDHYEEVSLMYIKYRLKTIQHLKTKTDQLIEKYINPDINEKHQHIFVNNGLILFDYLMKNVVSEKRGRNTDIIFYYWKMYDTKGRKQFIHAKPEKFKRWLENESEYNYYISDWKTFEEVKTIDNKRHNAYAAALEWFKSQKLK